MIITSLHGSPTGLNLFLMALNRQTFKTRTLTAAVFVVVMLAGLLINQWTFFLLFSVIHFGCWWEYLKLMTTISGKKFLLYSTFGLVYISLPIVLLIGLRNLYGIDIPDENYDLGKVLSLTLIFSLWINDTMAYIVGSLIGKTQMTKISPKKTWEGTIGGIILCIVVMIFIGDLIGLERVDSICISAIASIAGTFGDLLESKLKRMAGVKDSGHIMPGHGGFLDRFDSLLVATPFVWLYVYLFMQ
jgi:phosphatidate cytidylyltransferase